MSLSTQRLESSAASSSSSSGNVGYSNNAASAAASNGFYDTDNTGAPSQQQFACLYTKHKTQKRPVWHDGRLVLLSRRATLYSANPAPGSNDPVLDECEVSGEQTQALLLHGETRLETDKFLIQIEGPWVVAAAVALIARTTIATTPKVTSSSMQKLLNRKFQKPNAYVPPPPNTRPGRLHAVLGKRRRPLQPGELERLHYGAPNDGCTGPSPPPMQLGLQRPPSTATATATQRPPVPTMEPPQFQTPSSMVVPPQRRRLEPQTHRHSGNHGATRPTETTPQPSRSVTATFTTPDSAVVGAPDPFVWQAETDGEQRTNKANTNTDFVSNEFNATSFYGLEEEEEEEEGEDCRPHQTTEQDTQAPSRRRPHHQVFGAPHETHDSADRPNSFQLVAGEALPSGESGNSAVVSGNQLLALFGAAPTSSQAPSSASQDPQSHATPTSTTIAAPSTSQPIASAASQDHQQQQQQSHANTTATENSTKEQSNSEFVLPQPLDSSSDESSDQD